MATFTVLIGLQGSGKTHYTKELTSFRNGGLHLSSDEIRKELFGSEEDQSNNQLVFDTMLKRALEALESNIDVVYDATNTNSKRRRALLSRIPYIHYKKALVVARPFTECVLADIRREREVGYKVIERTMKSFQFPLQSEGFDEIEVTYNLRDSIETVSKNYTQSFVRICKGYDQGNSHHSLDLDEHMNKARDTFMEDNKDWLSDDRRDGYYIIAKALELHDIGKPLTRTHFDTKGRASIEAHYYGHESVSAYTAMFMVDLNSNKFKLRGEEVIISNQKNMRHLISLINYHMLPYGCDLSNEKTLSKMKNKLGSLYDSLVLMNKYDRLAK